MTRRKYKVKLSVQEEAAIDYALNIIEHSCKLANMALNDPQQTQKFLRVKFAEYGYDREHFVVLFLNARHKLISADVLFSGTIDGSEVHPRVVAKAALDHQAVAVILAHNHPSNHLEPSAADHALTTRLKQTLGLLDIRVLDHFIVAETGYVSFAEKGWL